MTDRRPRLGELICRAIPEVERQHGAAMVGEIARWIRYPAPAVRERCHALRARGVLIGHGTVRLAARGLLAIGELAQVYAAGVREAIELDERLILVRVPAETPSAVTDPAWLRYYARVAAQADLVIAGDPIFAARPDVARARRAGVPVVFPSGIGAYLSRPAW